MRQEVEFLKKYFTNHVRHGNCWDNAPQESFLGHMKEELNPYISDWTTLQETKETIDDWIDYYNNERYQWDLAKLSLSQFLQLLHYRSLPFTKIEMHA